MGCASGADSREGRRGAAGAKCRKGGSGSTGADSRGGEASTSCDGPGCRPRVVELLLGLVQDADPQKTPEQGVAFEKPLGVFLVQGQQDSGGLPDLGQGQLDPPDLFLVPQAILADQLQLLVEPLLFVGPVGGGVRLSTVERLFGRHTVICKFDLRL